ncbi:protein mono-ADP-ribosyltransferase PARP12-like isoform X2 [Littorina saxatilis]|uniref:protein mono-ADP-ribosyltransferase PARP12-like isoform X2 n=1 Tax=Littorina saxatilis TaxID=31220 RepID=UPI0038B682E7
MADTHPSRKLVKNALKVLLASARCDCRESVVNIFCKLKERRADAFKAADTDVLETWLRKCPKLFIVYEESGQVFVRPTAALGFCLGHTRKHNPCQQKLCNYLHACPRFFLTGACGFRDRCSYGHNLRTPLNRRLLKLHGVGVLDLTELRTLLRLPWVRRGASMPRMCRSYNSCGGCVREGGRCHGLHLCSLHVFGFSGGDCERNHDIRSQDVAETLALYGISVAGRRPEDVVKEVQAYVASRNDIFVYPDCDVPDLNRKKRRPDMETGAKPQQTGTILNVFQQRAWESVYRKNGRRPEKLFFTRTGRRPINQVSTKTESPGSICRHHLMGKCGYGESCHRLHSNRPFLWRMIELPEDTEKDEDLTWTSFDPVNNVLLEQYFSQPEIVECCLDNVDGVKMFVNFIEHMAECIATDKMYSLHRLGIPPRATLSSDQEYLATVWLWYWQNQKRKWIEFGFKQKERELC